MSIHNLTISKYNMEIIDVKKLLKNQVLQRSSAENRIRDGQINLYRSWGEHRDPKKYKQKTKCNNQKHQKSSPEMTL